MAKKKTIAGAASEATSQAEVAPISARATIAYLGDFRQRDTVECLEELLDCARRGELVGLAYAAKYQHHWRNGLTGDLLSVP